VSQLAPWAAFVIGAIPPVSLLCSLEIVGAVLRRPAPARKTRGTARVRQQEEAKSGAPSTQGAGIGATVSEREGAGDARSMSREEGLLFIRGEIDAGRPVSGSRAAMACGVSRATGSRWVAEVRQSLAS